MMSNDNLSPDQNTSNTRALFEHWVITDAPPYGKGNLLVRTRDGEYKNAAINLAWAAWRKALRASNKVPLSDSKWPKFANGKRGCSKCGAYADPLTDKVKHTQDC